MKENKFKKKSNNQDALNKVKKLIKGKIKDFLIKLHIYLDKHSFSTKYNKEVIKTFKKFLSFLYEKNINFNYSKITNKSIKLFCDSCYININTKYKITCILKKYLSILYKNKAYYKKKNIIKPIKKKSIFSFLYSKEFLKLIRFFKINQNIEGILCLYFLFFEGLTIFELSSLNKNNIINNNIFIKCIQRKRKYNRKIPNIISLLIQKLFSNNKTIYYKPLLFENIVEKTKKKRTEKIKNFLIAQYSKIINDKKNVNDLFNFFSKHRKALKFTQNCNKFFDLNIDICTGLEDENSIYTITEKITNDNYSSEKDK